MAELVTTTTASSYCRTGTDNLWQAALVLFKNQVAWMKQAASDENSPGGDDKTETIARSSALDILSSATAGAAGTRADERLAPSDPADDGTATTSLATSTPPGGLPQISSAAGGLQLPAPGHALENDPTVISQKPAAVPAEFMRSLSLVELARTLEGRKLHHFSVERMIGGGGMGAVFRGRDLRLDRDVAIKVIPESKRDPETLRRFRMEAQSAAKLDHPNIARVYDIGEDEAWNYIVFEFIDGINLRDLVLMEGPLSIDDAVFTTRQVAEALQHAHERDVVHRDIKPSNVIITPMGIAKVVDMGLARNTALDRSTADQTASGVTLGTFDYISPEQARDPRDADVRSDLYSLGCTMFYMLTGQPPFPDGTALQKLLNHGSQPHPDPRQWRDDISDELAAVLSKLMAKRPADRYQKPIELINDLLMIAQLESLPRARSAGAILLRPPLAKRSLLEQHLPWLVPLAVLLGSAFWLQSADSFSAPFELPLPTFQPPASASLPGSSLPLGSSNAPAGRNSSPANPQEPPPVPVSPTLMEAAPRSTDNANTLAVETLPKSPSLLPTEAPVPNDLNRDPNRDTVAGLPSVSPGGATVTSETLPESGTSAATATSVGNSPRIGSRETEMPVFPALDTNRETTRDALVDKPPLGQPESAVDPAREPSPSEPVRELLQDKIVVKRSQPMTLNENERWAQTLPSALMVAASDPNVRLVEVHESIELQDAISLPRSGLTLRGVNAQIELTLSGAYAVGMGWESWINVADHELRCENLRIHCRNDMRQPQAIFAMHPGGRLELHDCTITMANANETVPGACVLVKDSERNRSIDKVADKVGDKSVSGLASANGAASDSALLTSLSMRNCLVRGYQSLINMRTATRAEFALEKVCAMLEGRVLSVRGLEAARMPPVVRMSLDQSTLVNQQGFAVLPGGSGSLPPLTFMRTSKLCAYWSPAGVPHIAIEGLEDRQSVGDLLQLRGEENAYDQNIETLCQVRMSDGTHNDFSFRDAAGEWFVERYNDSSLRWQTSVPPDRPLEEQTAEDYRLRAGMFIPGFPPGLVSKQSNQP